MHVSGQLSAPEYIVEMLQVISKRAKMLSACAVVLSRHEKARMLVLACMCKFMCIHTVARYSFISWRLL